MVRIALAAAAPSPSTPFLSLGGLEESETGTMMIRERPNPKPLHNFTLPRLGWGSQIQMRCVKLVDGSGAYSESSSSMSAIRRRSSELPSFDPAVFGASQGEDEGCDGVEAVQEELMLDMRMKTDVIKKELSKKGDKVEEEEMEAVAGKLDGWREEEAAAAEETRPWNLRTRRAACKAPAGKNGSLARKEGLAAEEVRGSPEKVKEREKFAVALKRKEIEDDFWELTGHRPPRRPKKRLRSVQKQLDMLFPGLWLTEITADAYKVVEVPDNGKR